MQTSSETLSVPEACLVQDTTAVTVALNVTLDIELQAMNSISCMSSQKTTPAQA